MKVQKEWGVQFLATYALAFDEGQLSASWSTDPPLKERIIPVYSFATRLHEVTK
jgi:hypothetical protein